MTEIFDRGLLAERRRRARRRDPDGGGFLLEPVVDDLMDRLAAVNRHFGTALDLATPGPALARRLAASGRAETVVRLDRLAAPDVAVVAEAEALPFRDGTFDLVVSALALQFVNDLPGLLVQVRRVLRPDGLLLAAFPGGETLGELRESLAVAEAEETGGAAPRVGPFVELPAAGALLQRAGFTLPVIDQDRLTVRYASALDLMRDLRRMGAASVLAERSRVPLRRAVVARAAAVYADRFADADGRVRATFDIISLSGWAPSESQPKPLRPGSAKARLADALGAVERPAGEKAGG